MDTTNQKSNFLKMEEDERKSFPTVLSNRFRVDIPSRYEVDLTDWLHHSLTTILLLSGAILIALRQYLGKPISCWVPTEFSRAQEEYAEAACWVESTYFVANFTKLGVIRDSVRRKQHKQSYYQWVPFVLLTQSVLFYSPWFIWKILNWRSGYPIPRILEISRYLQQPLDRIQRAQFTSLLASSLTEVTRSKASSAISSVSSSSSSKSHITNLQLASKIYQSNIYITFLYLIIKFIFLTNSILQVLFMNQFLSASYSCKSFFGFTLLRDLLSSRNWMESGNFPRITLCDFTLLKLGNSHTHTVQCVLSINMLNEKIYLFYWFWILFVGVKTLVNFMIWIIRFIFPCIRMRFVKSLLRYRNAIAVHEENDLDKFVHKYLQHDGIFMLYLIKSVSGEIVCSEVVLDMWTVFVSPRRQRNTQSSLNGSTATCSDLKRSVSIHEPLLSSLKNKNENGSKNFSFKGLTEKSPAKSSNDAYDSGDFV